MKGLFLSIFCLLIYCTGEAQCPSNRTQLEVSVSYGTLTEGQIFDNHYSDPEGNEVTTTQHHRSSTGFLTLRYFFYNRLAMGFTVGASGDQSKYADPLSASVTGDSKQNATTFAVELYYIYVFKKYFELYTLAGAGPSFSTRITTEDASTTSQNGKLTTSVNRLDFQYTPIGIHAGGRFGAFLEFGIGYKGAVNGGLSFKIGRSGTPWWKD